MLFSRSSAPLSPELSRLDAMINRYNQLADQSVAEKIVAFREAHAYILELDGPEYCATETFAPTGFRNPKYRIGVCVRGTPLLQKE